MKTIIFAIGLILFSTGAYVQQRIVVEKATGNIVDIGEKNLQYDARYFDHLDYATSPIPAGENFKKYHRDVAGDIVLRSKDELTKSFADEWQKDLVARINGAALAPDL